MFSVPALHGVDEPVLVVDIGERTMRGLCYEPGKAVWDQTRLILPSPEALFVQRLEQAAKAGQGVFVGEAVRGQSYVPALRRHMDLHLPIACSPEAVKVIFADERQAHALGVRTEQTCPEGFAHVGEQEFSLDFWHGLYRAMGLSVPQEIVVAAAECAAPFGSAEADAALFAALEQIFIEAGAEGVSPCRFCFSSVPDVWERLRRVQHFSRSYVMPSFLAFLQGMLGSSAVENRNYREGILAVSVGRSFVRAGLLFRNKVHGLFMMPIKNLQVPEFLQDMDSFRLGWLPPEYIRQKQGFACVSDALPDEAEGFRPMYIFGVNAHILHGHGQMPAWTADPAMFVNWGLLQGYADCRARGE